MGAAGIVDDAAVGPAVNDGMVPGDGGRSRQDQGIFGAAADGHPSD